MLPASNFGDLPAAWATVIAALLAGLVAAISLAVNATSGRRERRRNLYSEAYRATMTWVEMAYRAYHAPPDDDDLLATYHKLWEDLRYYEGWVLFESPELGYSYARFKEAVERVCDTYIEHAWSQRSAQPRPLVELPVEPRPETYQRELDRFLQDVRDHLSPYPWRRSAMSRRVKQRIEEEGGARVSGLPVERRGAESSPETRRPDSGLEDAPAFQVSSDARSAGQTALGAPPTCQGDQQNEQNE